MIQTSGVAFMYDREAPAGRRLGKVTVDKEPLDPQRSYAVVTNAMLAHGGHNYRTFLEGRDVAEQGNQYEMIKAAIQKRGRIEVRETRDLAPVEVPRP